MTKISKKSAYPVKAPVVKDYFVGTDSEDNLKTVSFDFESTAKLINELNGIPVLNYMFKTEANIALEVLTEGICLSENNETILEDITKLYVNKKNFNSTDLTQLFRFISTNQGEFLIKIQNSSNLNNSTYLNIEGFTEFSDYFTIDISTYLSNVYLSTLVHFNIYFFTFILKAGSGSGGTITPDATTSLKGKVRLAGDLAGTANNPTVPELANKVVKETGKSLLANTEIARLLSMTAIFTTSLKNAYDSAVTSINNLLITGSRLITTEEIIKLSNTSATNTGDETTSSILTKIGDGSFINQFYLPSYVDDVLEFPNFASFPVSGETGKIYIDIATSKQWRWTGSAYIQITNGLIGSTSDVPEGTNLYFTITRVLATALSGVSATAGTFTSSSTILQAFGNIKFLIDNIATTYQVILTSTTFGTFVDTLTTRTVLDTDTTNLNYSVDGKAYKSTWLDIYNNYLKPKNDLAYQPIQYSQVILTANATALSSWNGKVVKVRGNITITIPASGLPAGYTFEFIVDPTFTLNWAIVTKTWVFGTPNANAAKTIGTVIQDEQDSSKIYLLT